MLFSIIKHYVCIRIYCHFSVALAFEHFSYFPSSTINYNILVWKTLQGFLILESLCYQIITLFHTAHSTWISLYQNDIECYCNLRNVFFYNADAQSWKNNKNRLHIAHSCYIVEMMVPWEDYSNFPFSVFFNNTGTSDNTAKTAITMTLVHEIASPAAVSWYKVVPAWIAMKDSGATPINVAIKNVEIGISMTGDTIFMNQFGRNGVIRRNNR